MKKILTIPIFLLTGALVLALSQSASANSGSIPYIRVLGIDPEGHSSGAEIYVTGTKEFYDFLPSPGRSDESYYRSLTLYSKSWMLSIWCLTPLSENSSDYTCHFKIGRKSKEADPNHRDFDSDSYSVKSHHFGPLHDSILTASGVRAVTGGLERGKDLFSFYGRDTGIFARKIIDIARRKPSRWGDLVLTGDRAGGDLAINCKDNYVRLPDTPRSEYRNDYKCTISRF